MYWICEMRDSRFPVIYVPNVLCFDKCAETLCVGRGVKYAASPSEFNQGGQCRHMLV